MFIKYILIVKLKIEQFSDLVITFWLIKPEEWLIN